LAPGFILWPVLGSWVSRAASRLSVAQSSTEPR
jgi:hypothetical protein